MGDRFLNIRKLCETFLYINIFKHGGDAKAEVVSYNFNVVEVSISGNDSQNEP
jgi:hypothetical protein